jgi:hypothetical protein
MALTAKEKGGVDIEPIPAGVYVATCYGLVDLGTHANAVFGGEQHKILVQWELPEVRAEYERDGAKVNLPRAISKRYTLSLSEKANLRRDLESWRGRKFTAPELAGFDLRALLGAACQLQIVHETSAKENRIYATIAAIMALPKGMPKPKPENPHSFFSFEEAGEKLVMPAGMPEWISKIITESREWRERGATKTTPASTPVPPPAAAMTAGTENDWPDVPF